MKKYYPTPTQVKFYDRNEKRWIGGIGYRDEIICGECGSIIEVDDLEENEVVDYPPESWIDFEEIVREE